MGFSPERLEKCNKHNNKNLHQNPKAIDIWVFCMGCLQHLRWKLAELQQCLSDYETFQKSVFSQKCLLRMDGLAYSIERWNSHDGVLRFSQWPPQAPRDSSEVGTANLPTSTFSVASEQFVLHTDMTRLLKSETLTCRLFGCRMPTIINFNPLYKTFTGIKTVQACIYKFESYFIKSVFKICYDVSHCCVLSPMYHPCK